MPGGTFGHHGARLSRYHVGMFPLPEKRPVAHMLHRQVRVSCAVLLPLALLLASAAVYADDIVTKPFKGVTIIQRQVAGPPREAIFVAELDLAEPTLHFTTTEPNGDLPGDTNTETTLDFVTRRHAQLGINANFFDFNKADPQRTTNVRGLAYSEGKKVSGWESHENALNITEKNEAQIVHRATEDFSGTDTKPPVQLYNAVSGGMMLVDHGKNVAHGDGKRHHQHGLSFLPSDVTQSAVEARQNSPARL